MANKQARNAHAITQSQGGSFAGSNWDESKHPRRPAGTDAGGEFAGKMAAAALDRHPKSSKEVNAALKSLGHQERLVRGEGYWYFIEGNSSRWRSSSVPVYRIDDLTIRQWVSERDVLSSKSW